MSDKQRKISITLFVLAIVFTIVGSTLAYWNWQTGLNDQTNVTFTVTSGFSCGADGGEPITSEQKILAPTSCTNENYAFQRTIVTNVTNNRDGSVYLDLYLQVNSIGAGLTASDNFKYALTEQANDCTHNIVSQGTFNGVTDNGKVYLFRESEYPTTGNHTYYLYVWLDAAETDSATQNQTFNISLNGDCSDNSPWVYTVNMYDEEDKENTTIKIGNAIPDTITQHQTPAAAMASLNNWPYYLKHLVSNGIVTESYVEFVVTPEMAGSNSGMTAGTYALKGGDNGASYTTNYAIITTAFGSNNCEKYNESASCHMSNLNFIANIYSDGNVDACDFDDNGCYVNNDGTSFCAVW